MFMASDPLTLIWSIITCYTTTYKYWHCYSIFSLRGIGVNVFPGHSQNRLHLQIFQKSLRTLVWHLYLLKRVHPACGGTSGSSNLTSFRSTMRRTSSCTLPTPMSRSMATSRCSSDFYVSVNFWLNFAPYQSMCGLDSREGWTKNWNSKSTLALSFYFWQFCTGESGGIIDA